ncbi:coproporphyrinogen III oxidase [Halarcobacter ebronensis]|uniref:Coproporphyrinogen III oxidase n=1 Tax=Halarcobacter ebronensis TaxID=1462615 RepID=A0A4Q0YF34_9BACT|nr:coproporphyrinogen III oxidase family protein [Halarcobacter ebronensis]RXJ69130.1 coproporphyrinogen III oxidase [Halarcobacter ebronensis]
MKNFIEPLAFLSGSKLIENSMNSCVNIEYTKEKIVHNFDKNKKYLLYMHIPFCEEFCTFCSFHKFKYNEYDCKKYFKKLRVELLKIKELGVDFNTLYIGGGTPLVNEEELLKTIEFAKEIFSIRSVSCETTPNHIDPQILRRFRGVIDRLSIGVQTFDDEILKKTKRYERYGSSKQLQEKISKIIGEFPIVSLDLIFNFPMQSSQMLINDLTIAKSLGSQQIVTYPLMTKHKYATTLEYINALKRSKEFEFYKVIKEELKYYIANNAWAFSKTAEKLVDEYIVESSEYIGVGSGAFSHINKRLYINAYDLDEYSYLLNSNSNAIIARTEEFSAKKSLQYQFLVHLFGGVVDIKKFNKLFNCKVEKRLKVELLMLKIAGAISFEGDKIYPTRFGEYLTLVMMKEFYMGMDRVRAKLRESIKSN